MYQKIKRTIFNILLLCFGFGLFLFNKVDSYASEKVATLYGVNGNESNPNLWISSEVVFTYNSDYRTCVYQYGYQSARVYSLSTSLPSCYTQHVVDLHGGVSPTSKTLYPEWSSVQSVGDSSIGYTDCYYFEPKVATFSDFSASGIPWFSDYSDVVNYLVTGSLPQVPFDGSLKLDSFKVSSWSVGNIQAFFKSKFNVTWSDSRISLVQVRIMGTANEVTYESSSSPFKGKFQADNFVFKKGDVIHLVATPFKNDGSYGESLYYSVTYDDDIPFSNVYRRLVNNNVNDNTLTIPYNDTSGNDIEVTVPVDGVSTNITYKVNYNPVTNEYGDINVYEIYYSPVVVYPDETTENDVDNTQDVIINNYNTTNYYETVQNIDTNFDIDITDVSSGDIQNTYDDIGDFFKGFGGFVGKLALLFNGLFPFLSPTVSVVLVTMVGIIAVGAVVILFLKIFHII